MKNFAKALADVLEGPPRMSQTDLANKTGMTKAKVSRLLSENISCDRDTLDLILASVRKEDQGRLVAAYIRDLASPLAIAALQQSSSKGEAKTPWEQIQLPRMSRKAQTAIRNLAESQHLPQFERIVIDLAIGFGVMEGK